MNAALLLLLFATSAAAQSLIPSYEPQRLANYLNELKAKEESCSHAVNDCESFEQDELLTKQLQTSLGIRACSELASARLRLDGVHDGGFVRMQCGWDLNLLFTEQTADGWRFLQTIIVPNKHWEATVSVASVTGDDSQQIVVHKAEYGSGTGQKQQNFIVYKLVTGKILPVLDVVESAYVMPPDGVHEVSQESRFIFKTAGPEVGPHFAETQVLKYPANRIELTRDHIWSSERHAFVATQWFSARTLMPPTGK